ncbi:hypothetical protein EZV62_019255 [Acer yangbiense]|uniref:Retrovirus-related Pol polyprotein from transposon TNT 1-94 n=1 Tax=Acer yangbiense TaxID=1000413 RepID=A0A5C7HB19_9ROSI|nr:hypothetical protein EZV62_019255 [Acer yangbiense]
MAQVKRAQLQALRREFEVLHMKVGETVNEYFARTLTIANKMKANGENKGDFAIIEKILRSLTQKFDHVVCSIEESKDLDILSTDELQSSLIVHEQRMMAHVEEEQALKVTHGDQSRGREVEVVEVFEEEEEVEAELLTSPLWNATTATI